jgi:hypothetical protein
MKVAIIGEKNRANAWEKHLRKLSIIREVVISPSLFTDKEIKAAILIDDTPNNVHLLHDSIRSGLHSFLVSRLPEDVKALETIYHSSEEANVAVQFSHWPSITPSTQWIRQQIEKPELIQIKKEIKPLNYSVDKGEFNHHWTDEVAFIVKMMGGNVHRVEAKPILIDGVPLGLQLTLRFEDSSIASIHFSAFGMSDVHQRVFSNHNLMIDCNVTNQFVRAYRVNEQKRITVQEKKFDPADTAEWALQQFFKSIQMNKDTVFSPYDALLTSRIVEKVRNHMDKW